LPNQEQHDPTKPPPYFDESLVINSRLNEIERHQREEKEEEREYKGRQLRFDRLMVVFTFLLFVTSAVSDVVYIRQASIAKDSSDAAKSAADTARKTLEAMNTGGAETKAQVDRLIAEQRRTAAAMENSLGQSRDSLAASIESFHNDQRAWVAILEFNAPKGPSPDEDFVVTYTLFNSGKTPAINVTAKARIAFANTEPSAPDWANMPIGNRGIVFPNTANRGISAKFEGRIITQPVVIGYASHAVNLYLRVRVEYDDTFGSNHWTEMCTIHSFGDPAEKFSVCASGSGIDGEARVKKRHYAAQKKLPHDE
jgi:hypothetical protein